MSGLKRTTMRTAGVCMATLAILAVPAVDTASANTAGGVCFTAPGQPCTVEWVMSRGRAVVSMIFSNGRSATTWAWCFSRTCTKRATGYPNGPSQALSAAVTGPNVSIIWIT